MNIGDKIVSIDGEDIAIKNITDKTLRSMFGYGHYPPAIKHRSVYTGKTFPHSPDTCPYDDYKGEWVTPSLLVCTGCGLDCT